MLTTMDTCTRILLVCLLFVYSYAEKIPLYKINVRKEILLEPGRSEGKILIDADVFFKLLNDSTFYIRAKSFNLSVQSENSKTISIHNCPLYKKNYQELLEPLYATYNNGLLQQIQVPKNNENLSLNTKLVFSLFFQVDATVLLGQISSQSTTKYTKQGTLLGLCDIKYDVSRQSSSDQSVNIFIKKTYDMNSCSKTTIKSANLPKLKDICNTDSNKNLQRNFEAYFTISNDLKLYKNVSTIENISYNPWINSPSKLSYSYRDEVLFKSFETDPKFSNAIPDNYDAVTGMRYTKVDDSLIDIDSSNQLQKLYSAFACDYGFNFMMDVYWYAIKCNS